MRHVLQGWHVLALHIPSGMRPRVIPELFGHKTVALFDLWSGIHFLTGCGLAYPVFFLALRFSLDLRAQYLLVLLLSASWELVELHMELGLLGGEAIRNWFQGVEHPLNRLISDQLLLLAGFWVARSRLTLSVGSKVLAWGWLLIHVFALPHSMWVQDTWLGSSLALH